MQPALVNAATAAVGLVLHLSQPADACLREFFSLHRELGSHDRAFVAESVFAVLRHKRLLEQLVGGAGVEATPRRLLLAALIKLQGHGIAQLAPVLKKADLEWAAALKAFDTEAFPPAVRLSLPDWLYQRLIAETSEADTLAFARSTLRPAPLDLRVNTLLAERDAVLEELQASGFAAKPTPISPVGIRLVGKPAINRHPLFTAGKIEVQDEGSQLLAYLVAPRRREMVVDFCAGAGGKTLALGAIMHSQGRLYAFDVSEKRLANLKPRLARSGLSNVHPQRIQGETDTRIKRLAGKVDRVLVDAPCSGLGTLRRNPDLKWRQSPQDVDELAVKQTGILAGAATLVKPGGRLVFATCSVLTQENDAVVDAFLASHPQFAALDCQQVLDESRIALESGRYLRLQPQIHDTDGFFAAVLERKA